MAIAERVIPVNVLKYFWNPCVLVDVGWMEALIIFLFLNSRYAKRKGMASMWKVDSSVKAPLKTMLRS